MGAGDAHSVLRALDAASAGRDPSVASDPSGANDLWLLTVAEIEALMHSARESGLHGERALLS